MIYSVEKVDNYKIGEKTLRISKTKNSSCLERKLTFT